MGVLFLSCCLYYRLSRWMPVLCAGIFLQDVQNGFLRLAWYMNERGQFEIVDREKFNTAMMLLNFTAWGLVVFGFILVLGDVQQRLSQPPRAEGGTNDVSV